MPMKIKAALLIIFISISCTSKHQKVSCIEYLDFNWSGYDAKNDNAFVQAFFKCRMYAHIDEFGKTRIFVSGNQYPLKLYYYKGQLDQALMQEIESFSNIQDPIETDSLYAQFCLPFGNPKRVAGIYDGTFLKLRVTFKNQKSKLFHFVNDEYSFDKYPQLLRLKKELFNIRLKEDTILADKGEFDIMKFDFIRVALVSDTSFHEPFQIPCRILLNDTIVNLEDFNNN